MYSCIQVGAGYNSFPLHVFLCIQLEGGYKKQPPPTFISYPGKERIQLPPPAFIPLHISLYPGRGRLAQLTPAWIALFR
jgi:hypothetical protein